MKKVWEVDPLKCPQSHNEMRIVSLINDAQIIERILRHVGMWVNEVCNHGVRIVPSTDRRWRNERGRGWLRGEWVI